MVFPDSLVQALLESSLELELEVDMMVSDDAVMHQRYQAPANCLITPIRPPRPNLGPETPPPGSWRMMLIESFSSRAAIWVVGMAALAAALMVRRRQRLLHASRLAHVANPQADFGARSPARSSVMDDFAIEVRTLLANHFGAHWQAKSTEEIRVQFRSLQVWLGEDDVRELLDLLDEADRRRLSTHRESQTDDRVLPDRFRSQLDRLRETPA